MFQGLTVISIMGAAQLHALRIRYNAYSVYQKMNAEHIHYEFFVIILLTI